MGNCLEVLFCVRLPIIFMRSELSSHFAEGEAKTQRNYIIFPGIFVQLRSDPHALACVGQKCLERNMQSGW